MASLPTMGNDYLSVAPSHAERTHKHRRSAAISGDFDAYGLGLFSPSNKPSSLNKAADFDPMSEPSVRFNFNNDEDFKNGNDFSFPNNSTNVTSKFLDVNNNSAHNVAISTPPRYLKKSLNSPIRLNKQKSLNQMNSASSLLPPQHIPGGSRVGSPLNSQLYSGYSGSYQNPHSTPNKFFLTEDTTINNDNVPDAMIDLDEVLNANLHIGDYNTRKEESTEDEFLASPFLKPTSSPYLFSPSNQNQSANLLQQPIQETNDDLEDNERELPASPLMAVNGPTNFEGLPNGKHKGEKTGYIFDDEEDIFNPPAISGNEIYSNSSVNSSSSSLRRPMVEKTFSNSSSNSNHSTVITTSNTCLNNSSSNMSVSTAAVGIVHSTGTPKRSGAKANRYKSFYDQSHKISNALKYSSSESVNSKPNSPQQSSISLNAGHHAGTSTPYSSSPTPHSAGSSMLSNASTFTSSSSLQHSQSVHLHLPNLQAIHSKKNASPRLLAHSSSLPSLKSRGAKFRYGDPRSKHGSPFPKPSGTINVGHGSSTTTTNADTDASLQPKSTSEPQNNGPKLSPPPSLAPECSSPVKKSFSKFIQKDMKMEVQSPKANNSPVSIVSDTNSTIISNISTIQSTDHSSVVSDQRDKEKEKEKDKDFARSQDKEKEKHNQKLPDHDTKATPSIVISNDSGGASPKKSPRRPLTPNEEKILRSTVIPPYNRKRRSIGSPSNSESYGVSNTVDMSYDVSKGVTGPISQSSSAAQGNTSTSEGSVSFPPRHKNKTKSFSAVFNELSPRISDDDSSIKSNRSNKFVNWFKRKT